MSETIDTAHRLPPALPFYGRAPGSVGFRKLRKRLLRQTREAMSRYGMDGLSKNGTPQKWLVCLSGGKDSHALLALLMDLKFQGLLKAELLACNLDQGQPGFPQHILPDYLTRLDVPHRIIRQDTYSVVTEKVPEGKTYCSLCSRLRRGILYRVAREEGCDAIVLGHHRDDALATFMMTMLHGGRLAGMPPRLLNDEGDLFVLRPLLLCEEKDLAKFAAAIEAPIIPCNLCGSQDGLQRAMTEAMLAEWEERRPGTKDNMFRALQNVRPSHLADEKLFDFAALGRKS